MTEIKLKRAYENAETGDGLRILVDRLWPRGLKKSDLPYDLWDKAAAPTNDLRRWFHANPAARWPEFQKQYTAELEANPAVPELIATVRKHAAVTLVFGAKDIEHNQAVVLREYLLNHL